MPPDHKKLVPVDLIVLADLGRVRVLRVVRRGDDPQEQDHLVEIEARRFENVGDPLRETVTDQAGRFGRHGMVGVEGGMSGGEEHNLESELERKAIVRLSAAITEILAAEGTPRWLLAAPKATLAALQEELPQSCRKVLARSIRSDVAREPLSKLERRFLSA